MACLPATPGQTPVADPAVTLRQDPTSRLPGGRSAIRVLPLPRTKQWQDEARGLRWMAETDFEPVITPKPSRTRRPDGPHARVSQTKTDRSWP